MKSMRTMWARYVAFIKVYEILARRPEEMKPL
jgi:hypothetical protein